MYFKHVSTVLIDQPRNVMNRLGYRVIFSIDKIYKIKYKIYLYLIASPSVYTRFFNESSIFRISEIVLIFYQHSC